MATRCPQINWQQMHPEALVYMLQQAVVLSAITSGSGKFKNQTEAFDAVAEECKKSAYFDGQYRDLLEQKEAKAQAGGREKQRGGNQKVSLCTSIF